MSRPKRRPQQTTNSKSHFNDWEDHEKANSAVLALVMASRWWSSRQSWRWLRKDPCLKLASCPLNNLNIYPNRCNKHNSKRRDEKREGIRPLSFFRIWRPTRSPEPSTMPLPYSSPSFSFCCHRRPKVLIVASVSSISLTSPTTFSRHSLPGSIM